MLRGRFNPYAVVNFMNGVVDPRATYNEYIDIKDKMSKYNRLLRRAGDETQQRELDGVKLKLAAFYVKNPRNPRDEDEPHTDADAIVYLDDDERLLETVDPNKLSDYLLYQS
jgi:hypothetical protein